jgi:O-antigen ligase
MCAAIIFYSLLLLYWIGSTALNLYGWHDQQRIAELSVLCVISILPFIGTRSAARGVNLLTLELYSGCLRPVLFAGFALCGLASVLDADLAHWALLEWALLLSLCIGIFPVAKLRQRNDSQFDRAMLAILCVVCAFYLFGFLGRYATLFAGLPLHPREMFTGFANLRFFGQFQTMTLPLLTVVAICGRSSLQRWGAFSLLANWWMLSIASGTRGTWLAMAAALTVVYLLGRRTGRIWMRWQIGGAFCGLGLYGLLFFVIPHVLGNHAELINRLPQLGSLSHREVLWVEAWQMIRENPLLGVGPMHFAAIPNGIGAHPHNSVLQIAAEWGVPALLMLLALVGLGFRRFIIALHAGYDEASFSRILALSLFASLVAAATQSLVDGVIVMPYSQVTLMVVAGWSMGICATVARTDSEPAVSTRSTAWRGAAMLVTQLVLLGILLSLAVPQVPNLQLRMQHYREAHHTDYFLPRFWQQGWINE